MVPPEVSDQWVWVGSFQAPELPVQYKVRDPAEGIVILLLLLPKPARMAMNAPVLLMLDTLMCWLWVRVPKLTAACVDPLAELMLTGAEQGTLAVKLPDTVEAPPLLNRQVVFPPSVTFE